MDKDKKPSENQHTGNGKIENSGSQSSTIQTPGKKPTGDSPGNYTNDKKGKSYGNRGLFWINIGMLLAFIIVNYYLIDNANRNIGLAEKRTQLELRAYLKMTDFELAQFNAGEKIIIKYRIENVGKTIARNVKEKLILKLGGTGIYPIDFENSVTKDSIGKTISIHNRKNTIFISDKPISLTDSIRIANGDLFMGFADILTYRDVFDSLHTTSYCWRFDTTIQYFAECDYYNIEK